MRYIVTKIVNKREQNSIHALVNSYLFTLAMSTLISSVILLIIDYNFLYFYKNRFL